MTKLQLSLINVSSVVIQSSKLSSIKKDKPWDEVFINKTGISQENYIILFYVGRYD